MLISDAAKMVSEIDYQCFVWKSNWHQDNKRFRFKALAWSHILSAAGSLALSLRVAACHLWMLIGYRTGDWTVYGAI
jgi:hypothetical protein